MAFFWIKAMHYYQFNIGDYSSHTKHLSPIEDICYRRLLDWYYLHEKPIPKDINVVTRMIMLNGCLTEVEQVLNEFFVSTKSGWINPRADKEIDAYKNKILSSSRAGKISAEKRKTYNQRPLNTPSTEVQPNNKQEPLNNNHKPITNSKGYRLSNDWTPPQEYIDFCKTERPELNARLIAMTFKDYWIGVAGSKGVKADWFATWRNWVRRQEVKSSPQNYSKQNEGAINSIFGKPQQLTEVEVYDAE